MSQQPPPYPQGQEPWNGQDPYQPYQGQAGQNWHHSQSSPVPPPRSAEYPHPGAQPTYGDPGQQGFMDAAQPQDLQRGGARPQAPSGSARTSGAKRGLIVMLAVVLVAGLGAIGYFIVYPMLGGSAAGNAPGKVIADIPERPSEAWSAVFDIGEGENSWFRLVDAGDDMAFVGAGFDLDDDYYADTTRLSMVELSDGSIAWEQMIDDQFIDDLGLLGSSDSRFVGTVGLLGDPDQWYYEDDTTYAVTLFSRDNGASQSMEVDASRVQAALAGDELFLAIVEDWESERVLVRKYAAQRLDDGPVWESTTRVYMGEQGLCAAAGAVVVGEVYGADSECNAYGEVAAYDAVTGESLGWARATGESVEVQVLEQSALLTQGGSDRRELTLVDERGGDLWERPIRVSGNGYLSLGSSTLYWTNGSGGLDAFDLSTGEALWDSAVRDVSNTWGELGNQVVARTDDRIVWIDTATGEINHTLRFNFESSYAWPLARSTQHLYLNVGYSEEVVAVSADGEEAWALRLGDSEHAVAVGNHLLVSNWEVLSISVLR